jgi:chromate transporter
MDAMVGTKSGQAAGKAVSARDALRDSFGVWTHVSVAGIGGPAKQIATMHRLAVEGKRWISEDGFFHALSYCIALPGPETQQLAIYVGWLANRTIGGIIAGGLFILPGAICMMALSFGYVLGAESQAGQAIFVGVRPAILAIMAEAIVRFGRHVLHGPLMLAVAALAFLAAFFKLPLPLIIFVPALLGIAAAMARLPGFTRPAAATTDRATGAHKREGLADHARPGIAQLARSLAIWLALWLAPAIALFAIFGMDDIYTQITLAFGKVALMAFGGDYAVVVYGAKQAVDSYHWISTREVQEGIAMGEIVPGTIMIVTQFFGFVAAYRDPGNLPPLLAGVFGGLLATWMTFIPCFLWILSIAPFIEGLRRKAILSNALQAVTAAAVGVIINLTIWFGIRTLFRVVQPVQYGQLSFDVPDFASFDPWALALFACAAIAVFRFQISAAMTLVASSAAGILLLWVGLAG